MVEEFANGRGAQPVHARGRPTPGRAGWSRARATRLGGSDGPSPIAALRPLRGVGKTVLLSDFARSARDRGWIVAAVEAGTDKTLRQSLAEGLHADLVDLAEPGSASKLRRALKIFLSFKAGVDSGGNWSFGLDLKDSAGGGGDTGVFETDLSQVARDLSAAAGEQSKGLAILIDEGQDLSREELTAVCSVIHAAGQQGWPLLVAIAGLPSLPRVLSEAKSYAERLFSYSRIEHLSGQVARDALTEPARLEGVQWEPAAVDSVVVASRGYPYFLQEYGQATWNEAQGPDVITLSDARVGEALGLGLLDAGFFRSRWDRATNAEKQYLTAMAQDGDAGSSSSAVATRLGRKPTGLGPARAALIHKGLIYAPDHGLVAFTVPGMAEFITRQRR